MEYFALRIVEAVLHFTAKLTLQSNTVHGESSCQLGGNLHATTNEGLPKHVLEGFVKVGTVAELADHWDGILMEKNETNKIGNNETNLSVEILMRKME